MSTSKFHIHLATRVYTHMNICSLCAHKLFSLYIRLVLVTEAITVKNMNINIKKTFAEVCYFSTQKVIIITCTYIFLSLLCACMYYRLSLLGMKCPTVCMFQSCFSSCFFHDKISSIHFPCHN